MELTVESARKLIEQTFGDLGDSPDVEVLTAVLNRLSGMYEMLKVLPSFKASRYHPNMFPDAVTVEAMLQEAMEQVNLTLENYRAMHPERLS